MKDKHTINALVRTAIGHLAKVERMLKNNPPNRGTNEIPIYEGTDELFNATVEMLEATSKYYNYCKNTADIGFLENLKL